MATSRRGGSEGRSSGSKAKRGRSRPKARDLRLFLSDAINTLTRQINEITLEDLRRFGMTVPRWSVLSNLAVNDGRTIGDLSRVTVIKQSSLTRVVDQMERDGLVERRPALHDSRYIEVWLTDEGRATYDSVVPLAVQRAHQAFEGFREAEVEMFTNLVHRLLENMKRERSGSH